MTATRALAFDLAGRGDFDSFGQTLVGFLFRHLTDSFKRTYLKHSKGFSFCDVLQGTQKYRISNLRYLQLMVNSIKVQILKKMEKSAYNFYINPRFLARHTTKLIIDCLLLITLIDIELIDSKRTLLLPDFSSDYGKTTFKKCLFQ